MRFGRIQIELTSRCNFACVFCPDGIMTRPRGDMSLSLLEQTLDQIVADRLTGSVQFHVMGEPMLYPHWQQALGMAKERGLEIDFTTNASAINPTTMQRLLEAGTDHILFSAQTPDPGSFALRKARIPFERFKGQITGAIAQALCSEATTRVTLSFLLTPWKALLPTQALSTINSRSELVACVDDWLDAIVLACGDAPSGALLRHNRDTIRGAVADLKLFGWNTLRLTDRFDLETRLLGDWVHDSLTSDAYYGARFGSCEGLSEHMAVLHNGDLVF